MLATNSLNFYWVSSTFTFLVQCVWGEWSKGTCSATCGKANSVSTRVKIVKESNGGMCEGKATKTEVCKVSPCPGTIDIKVNLASNKNKRQVD